MKFISLFLIITNFAFAQSISGIVKIGKSKPVGVLYVFAKSFDGKNRMPLAVKKIENPSYPYKFELSQKDAMMKGIPFKGPFKVTARVSPSGSVMDKSGVEITSTSEIKIGAKDIELVLP